MDFVAIAAISLNRNLVTAIGQQISHMVQAFAVVATGVLVTANQIAGDVFRNHGCPLIAFDEMIKLYKIIGQLQGSIKGVEHIAGMVSHDARVVGNPISRTVGVFHSIGHTAENLVKPGSGRLIGVGLVGSLEFRVIVFDLAALPLGAQAAQH